MRSLSDSFRIEVRRATERDGEAAAGFPVLRERLLLVTLLVTLEVAAFGGDFVRGGVFPPVLFGRPPRAGDFVRLGDFEATEESDLRAAAFLVVAGLFDGDFFGAALVREVDRLRGIFKLSNGAYNKIQKKVEASLKNNK